MSEIRTNLLSDAAGTGPAGLFKQSAAKAWANLNGTGTIALRQSFNVSSVVDNGVGIYTYNITSAFASVNYQAAHSTRSTSFASIGIVEVENSTASAIKTTAFNLSVVLIDVQYSMPSVHGDLA
jgi:hypothetical protein